MQLSKLTKVENSARRFGECNTYNHLPVIDAAGAVAHLLLTDTELDNGKRRAALNPEDIPAQWAETALAQSRDRFDWLCYAIGVASGLGVSGAIFLILVP